MLGIWARIRDKAVCGLGRYVGFACTRERALEVVLRWISRARAGFVLARLGFELCLGVPDRAFVFALVRHGDEAARVNKREQLCAGTVFCRIKVGDGFWVERIERQDVDGDGFDSGHPRLADEADLGHEADLGPNILRLGEEVLEDHLEHFERCASGGATPRQTGCGGAQSRSVTLLARNRTCGAPIVVSKPRSERLKWGSVAGSCREDGKLPGAKKRSSVGRGPDETRECAVRREARKGKRRRRERREKTDMTSTRNHSHTPHRVRRA
jgi:hypothetical protein